MFVGRVVGLAAGAALWCSAALAVECPDKTPAPPKINAAYPTSADEIRSQHQPWPRNALELRYDVRKGEDPVPKRVRFLLTPDLILEEDGQNRRIYDYRLGRMLIVDTERNTFVNLALVGFVHNAFMEKSNRHKIREVLATTFANPADADQQSLLASFDPFWVESELGISGKQKPSIRTEHLDDGISFLYQDSEAVRVNFSSHDLPEHLKPHASRIHRRLWQVHPEVAATLATARLPQRMTINPPKVTPMNVLQYELVSYRMVKADHPLPADAKAVLGLDEKAANLLDGLVRNLALSKPKTVDEYVGRVEKALSQGAQAEAFLWLIEMNTTHPGVDCQKVADPRCSLAKQIISAGSRGSQFPSILKAIKAKPSSDAVAMIDTIDRTNIANAYILDGFRANILGELVTRSSDPKELARMYAEMINNYSALFAGNPHAISFMRDVSMYHSRLYQPVVAWAFYDLGRQLPNRWTGDPIACMEDMEERIRRDHPDLF